MNAQDQARVMREVAAWYRIAADCLDDDDHESARAALTVAAFHAEPLHHREPVG